MEFLKPRRMENGCEYYLAGEVRLCIEQAARQMTESNSVYKELDSIINHQKYKRCLAMAQEWRNYAAFCGMQSSCHNHRGFGKTAEKYTWKECHAWKCVKHYKELADRIKDILNNN